MISAAMATQLLCSSLCSTYLGSLADSYEATKGGKNSGRLLVMSTGLLISTVAVLLHSLGSIYLHWGTSYYYEKAQQNNTEINSDLDEIDNSQPIIIPLPLLVYHLILRALFALGTAACMPVLDGLTLSALESEGRENYGKERLFGAISWGISHTLFGPVIDRFGYKTIYATTLLSFFGCILTFRVYANSVTTTKYIGVSGTVDHNEVGGNSSEKEEKKSTNEEIAIKHPQKGSKFKTKTSFEKGDSLNNEPVNNTNNESTPERLSVAQIARLVLQRAPILNAS